MAWFWMTSERRLAEQLRAQGLSYTQIAERIPGRTKDAVAAFLRHHCRGNA